MASKKAGRLAGLAALAGLATKPIATDWPGASVAFQDLGVTL